LAVGVLSGIRMDAAIREPPAFIFKRCTPLSGNFELVILATVR
jgi:hypothetical protein